MPRIERGSRVASVVYFSCFVAYFFNRRTCTSMSLPALTTGAGPLGPATRLVPLLVTREAAMQHRHRLGVVCSHLTPDRHSGGTTTVQASSAAPAGYRTATDASSAGREGVPTPISTVELDIEDLTTTGGGAYPPTRVISPMMMTPVRQEGGAGPAATRRPPRTPSSFTR